MTTDPQAPALLPGAPQTYEEGRHQRRIAICARRAVRDVFDEVRAEFGLPRKWSAERFINGARISESAINDLRRQLGLEPR